MENSEDIRIIGSEEFIKELQKEFPAPYFEVSADRIFFTSGYYSPRHIDRMRDIMSRFGVKELRRKTFPTHNDLPPDLTIFFSL